MAARQEEPRAPAAQQCSEQGTSPISPPQRPPPPASQTVANSRTTPPPISEAILISRRRSCVGWTNACSHVVGAHSLLDEASEFPRTVLDTLRQPLERGSVTSNRAAGAATRPCRCPGVLEAIEARWTALAAALRERLEALDGVRVHDEGERRCGIVTFTVDGVSAQDV